ncbi:hypothetical protein HMPREF1317_1229 [Schaalia georgiae F0490]|uniref:Uncharacterized protein n=1 Tax=Schaalia georgiae F0490 TaxID=1125717 RepID=J0NC76_9ACTO|nr:hypothetical protein HMPREF1317_1229 [Schaalia georgiae F0490]
MLLGISMGPVDTRNVHSGVNQCLDLLRRVGRGTNSADNLSSAHMDDNTVDWNVRSR